ncbi:MAG: peptide chain release factor-like protein [Lentisphaerae bacterium]|nr:peptide chain release factor-like protein [Lentisphaerota bacterium]
MVGKTKQDELLKRMEELGINERDLVEKFILGSGKGGQKINKTASCVYIKHAESGIEVKCQRSRSREMNRFFARRELCDKLEVRLLGEESKKQQEEEKIRRQKRRRTRRQKEKILADKRIQSEKKQMRAPPKPGDFE